MSNYCSVQSLVVECRKIPVKGVRHNIKTVDIVPRAFYSTLQCFECFVINCKSIGKSVFCIVTVLVYCCVVRRAGKCNCRPRGEAKQFQTHRHYHQTIFDQLFIIIVIIIFDQDHHHHHLVQHQQSVETHLENQTKNYISDDDDNV